MTNAESVLEALMGVRSISDFLSQYWMKKHCAFHGALDRLPEIARAPELYNLTSLLQRPHQRLRAFYKHDDGSHGEDFVTPAQGLELFQRKLIDTLVIDGVHWGNPGLANIALGLWNELDTPQSLIQCTAYASPAGHGTQFHFDQQEVFFLQLEGQKKWFVAPNEQVSFPLSPYFGMEYIAKDLRLLTNNEPLQPPTEFETLEMSPGSTLFLPRGYWHSSLAVENSVAITFTLCSRTWLEVIWEKLREDIIQKEEWRTLAVGLQESQSETQAGPIFNNLVSSLKESIDNLSLESLQVHALESDETRKAAELERLQAIAASTQN